MFYTWVTAVATVQTYGMHLNPAALQKALTEISSCIPQPFHSFSWWVEVWGKNFACKVRGGSFQSQSQSPSQCIGLQPAEPSFY